MNGHQSRLMKKSHYTYLLIIGLLCNPSLLQSQVKPVNPGQTIHHKTPKVFFLRGAKIIAAPGEIIESGEIVIRDGLIESVGKTARVPGDAFEIDLSGKTIYAGFIESYLERSIEKFTEDLYDQYNQGRNQVKKSLS